MRWFIGHYLSGREGSADNPRVSPLLADDTALVNSPPTLVITVESDVLCDEGEAYAARLEAVGVQTARTRYKGMFHGFFAFPEALDTGRAAVAQAGEAFAASIAS